MTTNTRDGQLYIKRETIKCRSTEYTNIFHTLCIKLGIKDSEGHLVLKYHNGLHRYIETEWSSLKSLHWETLTNMLSRSSKSSSKKISRILALQTHLSKSTIEVALTPKGKDKARMDSPRTTSPNHQQRRVTGSQRTPESGVSSTKSLGTTLMNVVPNSHCWLRRKPLIQMSTQTLIRN
jgi:hypothetical protein